jgi:hypothetical protein
VGALLAQVDLPSLGSEGPDRLRTLITMSFVLLPAGLVIGTIDHIYQARSIVIAGRALILVGAAVFLVAVAEYASSATRRSRCASSDGAAPSPARPLPWRSRLRASRS